jgi:glycosyltransferase involved in cell wall biosynthesis
VFLAPVMPAATGNGLAMRAGVFLEGLSRSHEVNVVVVPVFGSQAASEFVDSLAAGCISLELADRAEDRLWATRLLGTPEGRRRAGEIHPLPSLCPRLSERAAEQLRPLVGSAALIHVMRSYLAPCLDAVLDVDRRPPVTLDLDELDSAVRGQLGETEEAARFERLERYYIPRVDRVYTASPQEADTVRRVHHARYADTVPNAARVPFAIAEAPPEYDLLFVGNLSYAPNVDAARWLCEEIRPLLGTVTIAVVGSRPGPEVLRLGELPGVTVAGDVPEVTSWYGRARLAVVPLRIGGGIPTKIGEAQAHERPVVATPHAMRGVSERSGVLTARSTEEFAAACRRLLLDPAAAARLAVAGRRSVTSTEEVAQLIDRLARRARELGTE